MSNDKVAATFHGDDDEDPLDEPPAQSLPIPGVVHLDPNDPTAVPHAHMDEH